MFALRKKKMKYYSTATPVVTDDEGYLGYLWKGLLYLDRKDASKDFIPSFETETLYENPEDAIIAVELKAEVPKRIIKS